MDILIYYTPECHACKELKEVLTKRGIAFRASDYTQLESEEKKMVLDTAKKNRQMAFPIIFIDNAFIHATEVYNMLEI